MKASSSIRWRLVAALAGVSLFTLVVVGVVFYAFLGSYVVDRQMEQLLDQAVNVAEQIESFGDTLPLGTVGLNVVKVLLRSDLRVLPSGAGIVVFRGSIAVVTVGSVSGGDRLLERLHAEAEELGGEEPGSGVIRSFTDKKGRKADLLAAAAPIRLAGGDEGLAVVTLTRADAFNARTEVFRTMLVSGAIAIALACLVGWGLGVWMTRPLRRLSSSAKAMARGSYEQPVTGPYPGEIQELAGSMEAMRLEVRHSEESLRDFVASAAHEIRTPLTSIQGFSQALLDGAADTPEQQRRSAAAIYRESARLQRLVDALLTLSRYDSHEFEPSMTTVAVDALVREEVERLVQVGLAESGRIAVQVDTGAQAVTDGDMLRQAIGNLLRNAVQYGGADPVAVRVWTQGADLMIEVSNGGEPLSTEEKSRIFERFYRGSAGRHVEGLGLGLALVHKICDVLGGRIEVVGGGPPTRFRVTLPVRRY
ncbi:MAG: HAMP domain-containing histidine kinase [Thermoleophilia bacterium]|nr:HAMP domain-containing histidine kinase [Thermoleophilia bacterium]